MSANDMGFVVFVVLVSLVAILRLYRIRRVRMEVALYRSQIMCPACGSITARFKKHCLHCGKSMGEP